MAHGSWLIAQSNKIFSYQPSAMSYEVPEDEVKWYQLTRCHNGGAWKKSAQSSKLKAQSKKQKNRTAKARRRKERKRFEL